MPYPKEFSIVLFILLIALLAYLLMLGRLSGGTFVVGLVVAAVAVGVVHNIDVLGRLIVKGGGVEASVEIVREIRDEVFAKAAVVQRLAEQMAAMTAWGVANTGRFVGDDFQAQLLARRDELRRMLHDLQVSVQRSEELVLPITIAVAHDYRSAVITQSERAIVDRIAATGEQRKAILREVEQALSEADQVVALQQVDRIIAARSFEQPGLRTAVNRYREFLRQNPAVSSSR